jgi:Raf kinase inhibitor-like YbhB/YbcL family protein
VNLPRSVTLLHTAAAAALAAIAIAGCGGSISSSSSTTSSTTHSTSSTTAAVAQSTTAATTTSSFSGGVSTPSTTSTFSTTATLARGFHLTSPAFASGAAIPAAYTCDGNGVSPPLQISGVPSGATELVLVMRDPEAPGGNFVHWALAGIPPTTASLPSGGVPGLVAPGRNSFGTLGYRGPCPPRGGPAHHYVLTLSALSTSSGLRSGFQADQLSSPAVGIATLIGTYARR